MPDISNTSTPLTTNGDYTMAVVPGNSYLVALTYDTGTGTVTLKDSDGNAFRNEADDADIAFTASSTTTSFIVVPRGRQITLTLASASGASISHQITNLGRGR